MFRQSNEAAVGHTLLDTRYHAVEVASHMNEIAHVVSLRVSSAVMTRRINKRSTVVVVVA